MTAEEFDRRMAAILESFEKSRLEDEKRRAEDEKKAEQRRLEAEQRRAEDEKKAEQRKVEYEKSKADMEAYLKALGDKIDRTDNKVEHAKTDIAGISNSNGLAAEDYFYNSLEKTLTLGGLHFDYAQRGNRRTRKTPDGKKIKVKGQYDVLLVNGDSVAIVEIKYKADKEDIEKLADRQLENFRILYPEYAKNKIYLGIASFSIDEHAEKEARERGIAILKQNGDAIEVLDANLRAY